MTKHFVGWRKSRRSNPNGGCVEVARAGDGVIGVRDSKGDPEIVLELTQQEWARLLGDIKTTNP